MTYPLLRDFLDACDAFIASPTRSHPMARLVVARLKLLDSGVPEEANWSAMLRVMMLLAVAAQEAVGREERRDAIAEIMRLTLSAWRCDLGDGAIAPPKAPPARILQYKD